MPLSDCIYAPVDFRPVRQECAWEILAGHDDLVGMARLRGLLGFLGFLGIDSSSTLTVWYMALYVERFHSLLGTIFAQIKESILSTILCRYALTTVGMMG